jgi:hypothetical protein
MQWIKRNRNERAPREHPEKRSRDPKAGKDNATGK